MLILLSALFVLFFLSIKFNIKPYLTLLSAGLVSGLILEISFQQTISLIFEGFTSILVGIGPIIIAGTLLGVFLQKGGLTKKMVGSFISLLGHNKIPFTLNMFGFIISIPVFCDAAFILMSSIIKEISSVTGKKIIVLAVCLATGLYSAHVFVPPTPGPLAAAAILKADIGLLLIVGLFSGILVSIGGYLWIKMFFPDDFEINMKTIDVESYNYNKSLIIFSPIAIPILLISLSTLIKYPIFEISESIVHSFIIYIGKPEVALLTGIIISSFFIEKTDLIETPKWIIDSLKKSFDILLITGAGGAFGFIIRSSGLIDSINLDNTNGLISIVTVFIISASIKTIQGSSTVALITTCALVAPLIESLTIISEIEKVIFIISIGSGAMTVSHVNDSYFWVVSKYSNISMADTIKFFTTATFIQGIIGLIISITLFIFLT